jgi:hypothetical protein
MPRLELAELRNLDARLFDLVATARLEGARARRAEHVARRAFDRRQRLLSPRDKKNLADLKARYMSTKAATVAEQRSTKHVRQFRNDHGQ